MAKIRILGQFDCVTSDKILAVSEQISYEDTTVAAALDAKQDELTFDSEPVQSSTNPVTSGGLYTKFSQLDSDIASKQDTLTWDNAPVQNSDNPVKSGGLYTKFTQVEGSISNLSTNLSTNYYTSADTDSAIESAFVSRIATDAEFTEMLSEIFAA